MRVLVRHLGAALILTSLGLNNFTSPANAKIIRFEFDAVLFSGPLAVTYFDGNGSYDDAGLTGVGPELQNLASLDFTLRGFRFTLADCRQGCQINLLNGIPFSFTDFIMLDTPLPANAPVATIVFGFGEPGGISYFTTPGFNFDPEVHGTGLFILELRKKPH